MEYGRRRQEELDGLTFEQEDNFFPREDDRTESVEKKKEKKKKNREDREREGKTSGGIISSWYYWANATPGRRLLWMEYNNYNSNNNVK